MLMEAMQSADKGDAEAWAPPMQSWSAEVDVQHKILDAIHRFNHTAIALKVGSAKAGQPPKPHPRPRTAFDKVKHENRRQRHEALANRVLARRKKRKPGAESAS